MRLKVSSAKKASIINLEDGSDVSTLLEKLLSESLISEVSGDVKIKAGFPPKAIDLSHKSTKIQDIGIRSGDKLIVEEFGISPRITPRRGSDKITVITPSTPHIKIENGYVILRKIPDDNSCLFRSISYAVFQNLEEGSQLRSIVADAIRDDPDTYSDVILGKPRAQYISWIQKPTSWGGAIELQIISEHLGINIKSVDVENGRTNNFNEGQPNFIILFYTGIHYDTIVYTPSTGLINKETDISVFKEQSSLSSQVLKGVQQLSKILNHKGYVTNTSTIKIKCNVCGTKLNGQNQASYHASETGHMDFGEIN